jgi:putative ABC transport system substrate-binding protein
LPALAADLVRRRPAIIVAVGSNRPAAAARAADANIPIVFNSGSDPVQLGFVASMSRPGGEMTGAYSLNLALTGKMLSLLHELVPKATKVALLQTPGLPENNSRVLTEARQAVAALGLQLLEFSAGTDQEIEAAFAHLIEQRAEALLVPTNPFLISQAERIATIAARLGVPTMYGRREFVAAGGLISYGDNVAEGYRQVGLYVGRILKGEKPADLPVVQSSKLELVINLKTAKSLGLTIPETLLATADEVIQ